MAGRHKEEQPQETLAAVYKNVVPLSFGAHASCFVTGSVGKWGPEFGSIVDKQSKRLHRNSKVVISLPHQHTRPEYSMPGKAHYRRQLADQGAAHRSCTQTHIAAHRTRTQTHTNRRQQTQGPPKLHERLAPRKAHDSQPSPIFRTTLSPYSPLRHLPPRRKSMLPPAATHAPGSAS